LLDTDPLSELALIPLQSIKFRKTFYLLKQEKEIDHEAVQNFNILIRNKITNYYDKGKNKRKFSFSNFECKNKEENSKDLNHQFFFKEELKIEDIKLKVLKDIPLDDLFTEDVPVNIESKNYISQPNFKLNKLDYVKVKLLFNQRMLIPTMTKSCGIFSCCVPSENKTRNTLIIHVHGGGYVAMSSTSHECYLRK